VGVMERAQKLKVFFGTYITYYEDLTTEKIAQILGVTPANVRQRRCRAIEKLKQLRNLNSTAQAGIDRLIVLLTKI
jgi:DNA-directed RNA polymerase sigma subunit (sigma70/sigma32)